MCSVAVEVVNEAEPVPLEDLGDQICQLAADLAAGTCRWLMLLAEFDLREGWAEWGVNSCAHWLSWRCGIGLNAAREHVRIARSLRGLPLVSEHFGAGKLSYSKVRAITRVAQPETEAQLVELARHSTGSQMDKVVRGYAGVIRRTRESAQEAVEKAYLSCQWADDGMLRIEGRLTAEDGALLLNALRALEPPDEDLTAGQRGATALVQLASGDGAPTAELVVHVDAETLEQEQVRERCEIEDGPSIAAETARRLGCDGALVTIVERDGTPLSVGRRTRAINPALGRALKSRDGGCRFPGCTHTRFLHGHHVVHWANGGLTELANLIQLCSHHHRLLHEGGFRCEVGDDGEARFFSPRGWEIPPFGLVPPLSSAPMEIQNDEAGIYVDPNTCRPLSAGDRLDYGIAVEGLARRWLPPPPA